MALPEWMEWASAGTSIAGSLVAVVGVPIAIRGVTEWRRQRRTELRGTAAARVCESLLRAASALERFRFNVELSTEGFIVATESERLPDRVRAHSMRVRDELRSYCARASEADEALAAARADVIVHLPEANAIVEQGEVTSIRLAGTVHGVLQHFDGEPPRRELRDLLEVLKGDRHEELRALREAIGSELAPLARGER